MSSHCQPIILLQLLLGPTDSYCAADVF